MAGPLLPRHRQDQLEPNSQLRDQERDQEEQSDSVQGREDQQRLLHQPQKPSMSVDRQPLTGPAGVAFTWSFMDTVYLCTRGRRSFEPTTRMKFDLILGIAFAGSSSLTGFFGSVDHPAPGLDQTQDEPHLARRALTCFGVAEVFVHAVLFAIAYREWKAPATSEVIISSPSTDDLPLFISTSTPRPPQKTGSGLGLSEAARDEEESLLSDSRG
ncbi:hypothetical protein FALBO_14434 [Fusarium albosuccineum]|uniref:Uncharacterized protein n=1 Tax=Fusarium albosuccineum TaxID=1237068 RepID=A0A8H4PFL6_9HYPO|nr:hypothetical protein FALBO_14434 [Fusarium albosuccineum]